MNHHRQQDLHQYINGWRRDLDSVLVSSSFVCILFSSWIYIIYYRKPGLPPLVLCYFVYGNIKYGMQYVVSLRVGSGAISISM